MAEQPLQYPFSRAGDQIDVLFRDLDRCKAALGSPDSWPQSLRNTVQLMLG